ncbi:hypothetical protein Golomagni_05598 [Golovinomyces magnicellulatus]|nr:hypothetical protein Golomagni_05598 [Golovinomyces magnicellulatus]
MNTAAGYLAPTSAPGSDGEPSQGERGYRRRKLAAMAGNLYRTGQQAVTDLRETYVQTRGQNDLDANESTHIPGAFPDVAITSQGNEQMVLFPSYAKRHTKKDWTLEASLEAQAEVGAEKDEEFWRREWERHEDAKAIVDVDVRGWIYSSQSGPMTRRNRILLGLARQLSGISTPRPEANGGATPNAIPEKTPHQIHEELREQERIAQEAAMIERKGQEEKRVAYAGGYSEEPSEPAALGRETRYPRRPFRRGSQTPESAPGSPTLGPRQASNLNELTEAELAVANANLMARIAPFMTNPLVSLPITLFFYSENQSQSRTVITNDAGHFIVRAALDFIPTHVRVLANETLSATQEIKVLESRGVSLISDIDDTIKKSNITLGAREIFRNTFIRDLSELTIDGVQGWYNELHTLGVGFHYCSNSPWQLFPVLASFFKMGGLPTGSLHLKLYSGMLQGIFEPVAERKKGTLTRLLNDFPERKFLLVGDSGEADLEVYTDLALAHPGQVLAIFIRDVTTPDRPGYFDSAYDMARKKVSSLTLDDGRHASNLPSRQNSAPITPTESKPTGPLMGTLIDFAEEPEEVKLDDAAALAQVSKKPVGTVSAADLLAGKRAPPPRPAKPAALRSATSAAASTVKSNTTDNADIRPPVPPRKPVLTVTRTASDAAAAAAANGGGSGHGSTAPSSPDMAPPPLPRRRVANSLKNLSPRLFGHGRTNSDIDFDPLPPAASAVPSTGMSYYRSSSRSGGTTPTGSPILGAQGVNRKLELWRRRVARAHEVLETQGIVLYTWRQGQDVSAEAVGIVKRALEQMGR